MNCREFVDFLMDYLEGELPGVQLATFEEHMEECPPCVRYLDSYKQTVRLGKELLCDADEDLPGDVPRALVEAILAARARRDQPPEK